MLIGLVATTATILIGLVMGTLAGYFGGRIDTAITAVTDLLWGFPLLLVAVVYAGRFKPGALPVVLALATIIWAGFARVIRAQVRSLSQREFIEATRALGVSHWRIIVRHLFPNVMGTVLVMGS